MTLPGFVTCPECGGMGELCYACLNADWEDCQGLETCPECGGAGQVPSPETVERMACKIHEIDRGTRPTPDERWSEMAEELREFYRLEARAALLEYARHVQEGEK